MKLYSAMAFPFLFALVTMLLSLSFAPSDNAWDMKTVILSLSFSPAAHAWNMRVFRTDYFDAKPIVLPCPPFSKNSNSGESACLLQ